MQAFSDNGIYVFLDLDTFNTQIEETNPQWTYNQYTAFTAVIDAFAKYDNIAGFFVANEVTHTPLDHYLFPSIGSVFSSRFNFHFIRSLVL
jgi:hypothetical protein